MLCRHQRYFTSLLSPRNISCNLKTLTKSTLFLPKIYAVKLHSETPILKYSRKRSIHLLLKLQNNRRYPASFISALHLSRIHWKPAADREVLFCSKCCALAEKAHLQKGHYFMLEVCKINLYRFRPLLLQFLQAQKTAHYLL